MSAVSYSPSSRSSSWVSSFSMMPVMSLATSCSVLEVGSDCFSMAAALREAQGSPGTTARLSSSSSPKQQVEVLLNTRIYISKFTFICVTLI